MPGINYGNSLGKTAWRSGDGNGEVITSSSTATSASSLEKRTLTSFSITSYTNTNRCQEKSDGKQKVAGANGRAINALSISASQHFNSLKQLGQYLKKEQRKEKGIDNVVKLQRVRVDVPLDGVNSLVTCHIRYEEGKAIAQVIEGAPAAMKIAKGMLIKSIDAAFTPE